MTLETRSLDERERQGRISSKYRLSLVLYLLINNFVVFVVGRFVDGQMRPEMYEPTQGQYGEMTPSIWDNIGTVPWQVIAAMFCVPVAIGWGVAIVRRFVLRRQAERVSGIARRKSWFAMACFVASFGGFLLSDLLGVEGGARYVPLFIPFVLLMAYEVIFELGPWNRAVQEATES